MLARYNKRTALVLVLLTTAACGSAVGTGSKSGEPSSGTVVTMPSTQFTGEGDAIPLDFSGDPPIVGLSAVGSVAEAAKELPFQPVAPAALGKPSAMLASPQTDAFALVYDDPSYGRYWIEETYLPAAREEEFDKLAKCDPVQSPGCNPEWEIAVLSDGSHALTISSPPSTVAIFLQGLVRFDVLGPPDTFKLDMALSVSEDIVVETDKAGT
jgi:hypothetical protein